MGNGGYPYKMIGDAFQAAFQTAPQALYAAIEAQRGLHSEPWPSETGEVRVRMALHTGVTEERESDYVGPLLNRVARLVSAGHDGQVLLSLATEQLVRDQLPIGVSLRDMGEHRLKDLIRPEQIFQLVCADLPSDFPPLRTLDSRPNNLPLQSTPFIGREQDAEATRRALLREDVAELTLTGPGGIGKTRLALQAAAELLEEFPDGVFFVNLTPLLDPNLVIPTIAQTLGLREAGGQPIAATLKEYLRDKRLLLLLDNFEQVLEAAPQVADLLKSAPHLKALVTSRAPLHLSMEHERNVSPLRTPRYDPRHPFEPAELSQYESVALFMQRAQAVQPDFEITGDNASDIAKICARLEGMPLAIELAAARIKVLPPRALLARMGDRLRLLTGGARDLPARQQTLRNTIEWSYDLLNEDEKRLFRRMSAFRGGRTLQAAETVCDTGSPELDVLDGITSLVDKSLLYRVESLGEAAGEPRYLMMETIYDYARERLEESGEAGEVRRRHALYFLELVEGAESELTGPKQVERLNTLEAEHDNIRTALRWARETAGGGADSHQAVEAVLLAMRMAGALWRFWYMHGDISEGREELKSALALAPDRAGKPQSPVSADVAEGTSAVRQWRAAQAKALNGEGNLARVQGDYASARTFHEQRLAIMHELGDARGIAGSLGNLGLLASAQGDYAAARSLVEEALVIFRELGDKLLQLMT